MPVVRDALGSAFGFQLLVGTGDLEHDGGCVLSTGAAVFDDDSKGYLRR